MSNLIELTGMRFGRLLVMSKADHAGTQKALRWNVVCDCGKTAVVLGKSLRYGTTKSCGCFRDDDNKVRKLRHGHSRKNANTRTYRSWVSMRQRCLDSNMHDYPNYGGRGITICERWQSFENFLADIGERPDGKSLDRIDVNGNYEPTNCRWADNYEQQNNTRANLRLTFNGKTQTIPRWARELGFPKGALYQRIYAGWSAERALTQPIELHSL